MIVKLFSLRLIRRIRIKMKNSIFRLPIPMSEFNETERIDKKDHLPAYAQLARILKQRISDGTYQPGSRLPSEAAIAENFGISAMTARQAIGILAQEGLVDRVQGRGTFIKRLKFTASHFGLESLSAYFKEKERLSVRIIKTEVKEAQEDLGEVLQLKEKDSVILVERIIMHDKNPLIFHVGYARADPKSPFIESMLDTDVLTGLLVEESIPGFKKARLQLLPTRLDEREAESLQLMEGQPAFKLEHLYFDYSDRPSAFGWFLISAERMPMICKMGVWHD
jgi:DNA-binding GntR family transcriptional regulator